MFPYFTLFGREIGLYPLMALRGIFAYGIYACFMAKKFGYDYTDLIIFLLFVSIGVDAFYGNQLTSVAIPDGVTEIGVGTFEDN